MARVKQALRIREDRPVDEVSESDASRYAVVRVPDKIVVDLMAACLRNRLRRRVSGRDDRDDRRRSDHRREPRDAYPHQECIQALLTCGSAISRGTNPRRTGRRLTKLEE